eukprot:9470258-Pyramimonas_sp.AAC.3
MPCVGRSNVVYRAGGSEPRAGAPPLLFVAVVCPTDAMHGGRRLGSCGRGPMLGALVRLACCSVVFGRARASRLCRLGGPPRLRGP